MRDTPEHWRPIQSCQVSPGTSRWYDRGVKSSIKRKSTRSFLRKMPGIVPEVVKTRER